MDEDSSRPRYVERKGGGIHPAVDRKRLNIMMMTYDIMPHYIIIIIILIIMNAQREKG